MNEWVDVSFSATVLTFPRLHLLHLSLFYMSIKQPPHWTFSFLIWLYFLRLIGILLFKRNMLMASYRVSIPLLLFVLLEHVNSIFTFVTELHDTKNLNTIVSSHDRQRDHQTTSCSLCVCVTRMSLLLARTWHPVGVSELGGCFKYFFFQHKKKRKIKNNNSAFINVLLQRGWFLHKLWGHSETPGYRQDLDHPPLRKGLHVWSGFLKKYHKLQVHYF